MKRIFVSSVQKEFEKERLAIKRMVESDPIVKAYYETFVFEIDAPAADKSTQEVYLNEAWPKRCLSSSDRRQVRF